MIAADGIYATPGLGSALAPTCALNLTVLSPTRGATFTTTSSSGYGTFTTNLLSITFDGITFTGGTYSFFSVDQSSVRFSNCMFKDINSTNFGGAVHFTGTPGLALFENTTFARVSSSKDGGCLYINSLTVLTLRDCLFDQCRSGSNGGSGGAAFTKNIDASGVIVQNSFSYQGAAFFIDFPVIKRDLITVRNHTFTLYHTISSVV